MVTVFFFKKHAYFDCFLLFYFLAAVVTKETNIIIITVNIYVFNLKNKNN